MLKNLDFFRVKQIQQSTEDLPLILYLINYLGRERKHVEDTPTKRRGPIRIMTPQNELRLTLIRLRLGLSHRQFAYMFDISETQVVSVVITWIRFMYVQFKRSFCHLPHK